MKTKASYFLLLGCFILLLSSVHCQDDSSSDDDGGIPVNPSSFDDYDDLDDFMMDDHDPDIEDFQEFYSRNVQDLDAESLQDTVSSDNLVVILYTNEKYPEDNKIYEDFFKSLVPYFGSGAFEIEVSLGRYFDESESELPDYYVPNSFPALVVFDHVRMFEYNDELALPEFFGWFTQIVSREFTELQDQDSLDRFLESDENPKLVAFYNSRDAMELEMLSELASKEYLIHLDVRQIAICLDHCSATYGGKSFNRPSLVLFRNYEKTSPYAVLSQNLDNAESVFSFCNYEALPPVIYYDELNQTKIFGEVIKSQITIILNPEEDNSNIISEFEKSAYHNIDNEPQSDRMIHVVNYYDESAENLHWFYNVHNISDLPKLFITQTSDDLEKIYKFRYDGGETLNYETFRKFIANYREDKLEHFFISEEIPNNEGKTVNKIVGNTYKQEVLDNDANYLVYICPEIEDEMCSEPLEIFEKAAQKIVERGEANRGALKFGYIDVLKNEMDMDVGDSFPEIRLYKSGNKKKPMLFKSSFTEEELVEWIIEQVNQIETGLNRKDNMGEIKDNAHASVEL